MTGLAFRTHHPLLRVLHNGKTDSLREPINHTTCKLRITEDRFVSYAVGVVGIRKHALNLGPLHQMFQLIGTSGETSDISIALFDVK